MKMCIYGIPCECGGECIGETSRPLNVRIRQHICNLRYEHCDKSRLTSHAFAEVHKTDWTNTTTMKFESNSTCRSIIVKLKK
jgi:hypothetical protein